MRHVDVKNEIRGATAKTHVELSYHNPSRDGDLRDSVFSFPLDEATMLTKFEAVIDDTVVYTKIKRGDNAEAEDNFLDVSDDNRQPSGKPSSICFKLGKIEPGQPVTIKIQIITLLEVVSGHFLCSLPEAFHPDYSKHGVPHNSTKAFDYGFNYDLQVIS